MHALANLLRNQCPNWRYIEIEHCLRQKPSATPRFVDTHVNNYIKVAKALSRTKNSAFATYELAKDPVLLPYLEVFNLVSSPYGSKRFDGGVSQSFQRSILEALTLCNVPVLDIAFNVGVSKEAVEVYEAIFFDIRGRAPYWVASMILQPLATSFTTANFDSMLKFAAVAIGKIGVDQLLFQGSLTPDDMATVRQKVMSWRMIKAAASTFMIPVDKFDHIEFERNVGDEIFNEQKVKIAEKEVGVTNAPGSEEDLINALIGAHTLSIASKYNESAKYLTTQAEEPHYTKTLETVIAEKIETCSNDVVRT